jgi:peptidoglycan LD-endopeptidase LytH
MPTAGRASEAGIPGVARHRALRLSPLGVLAGPAVARLAPGLFCLALLALLAGCRSLSVPAPSAATDGRERYIRSLERAGLAARPLAMDWMAAGERAMAEPQPVSVPFREIGFFDPARPKAVAYALVLRRGQQVEGRLETYPADLPLFVELLRPAARGWEVVAVGDASGVLRHRAPQDQRVVLRLQPELLAGGRYTLDLVVQGALLFPVAGSEPGQIISRFGDPRDGGRRQHLGIDIAAPRGTPALAAEDATVMRVGESRLGGKVVWLLTDSGLALYYAHLDRQLVREGQRVARGDRVGLVGDTGNARGTRPHLHFEVQALGTHHDPEPWVRPSASPAPVVADVSLLGSWARVAREGIPLHAGPSLSYPMLAELPLDHPVRVRSALRDWYHVELPHGGSGYMVAAGLVTTSPLRILPLVEPLDVRAAPQATALPVARIGPGREVEIVARAGATILIRGPAGELGWADLP